MPTFKLEATTWGLTCPTLDINLQGYGKTEITFIVMLSLLLVISGLQKFVWKQKTAQIGINVLKEDTDILLYVLVSGRI